MLYECRYCGKVMADEDFALIRYKGKDYGVCPDCLDELIKESAVSEIDEHEYISRLRESEREEAYKEEFLARRCM